MEPKPRKHREHRRGPVQQKVLLLLWGGLALGCSRRPDASWKIIGMIAKEWRDISRQSAERAIQSLYESNLLKAVRNTDGTVTLVLNDKGKKKALTYQMRGMKIATPEVWGKNWWLVLFDIPEDESGSRKALREHLDRMGFFCLQKSAWIYPFDCRKEIEFIVEMLDIRAYVRMMCVDSIDNELHLKRVFHLS